MREKRRDAFLRRDSTDASAMPNARGNSDSSEAKDHSLLFSSGPYLVYSSTWGEITPGSNLIMYSYGVYNLRSMKLLFF